MYDLANLVATLKLMREEVEAVAASNADDAPILLATCRDAQQWIEALQRLEQADDESLFEFLDKTILRRKGICILRCGTVREMLRAKGFARPAQDVSNERLVDLMESNGDVPDLRSALAEIEERVVETTARDVVEDVGLDGPEPTMT